jgi:4-diphosphocytidyl-2-C-methyl-D-erythritol kinase
MRLKAPAKVNLTLEVLARRTDGYHGVRSLMVPLDLSDELSIEPSAEFTFDCNRPELRNPDNLALRALRALGPLPNVALGLHKAVPVQAGLGGGSSDAAAVLRADMAGAFGRLADADWLAIARRLGSDVPFFLAESAALVEGSGERVTPAGRPPPWHVLIVKPPVGVSTAAAYARLDERDRPIRPRAASVSIAALRTLQRGRFDELECLLHNDFQAPLLESVPEIGRAIEALREAGARKPLLAGSGSCVFTIAPTARRIAEIAERCSLPASYERFVTRFAQTPSWLR